MGKQQSLPFVPAAEARTSFVPSRSLPAMSRPPRARFWWLWATPGCSPAQPIEQGVPGWLRNTGRGWVTAEYSMLPRSTVTRTPRESERGKIGGRTHEIQRLIGRSLRSVVDMQALGERTVILDCDVIQADGGTRTAAITGAAVALALALDALVKAGTLKHSPLKQLVAATSVGIVDGVALLDLCYEEDAQAEVDMNVVMTADGGLVETQATAEKGSFSRSGLNALLDLAEAGLKEIFAAQRAVLK